MRSTVVFFVRFFCASFWKRLNILLRPCLLSLATAAASPGADPGTFGAFGPEAFARVAGKPQGFVRTFSVLDPRAPYVLKVANGASGDFTPVSSAVIRVNGIQILGPDQFNPGIASLERPLRLDTSNEIAVEVRGRPGSGLTVEVIGIDRQLPTITATVSPAPNSAGWHKTDVTVSFACADVTSGIVSCPPQVVVSADGAAQVVSGTAVDRAGNAATTAVTVNLDKTPPTIAARMSPEPNPEGWHNTEAAVAFTCADDTSGVVSCPDPVTVTAEGAAQVLRGTAVDRAGNTAAVTVTLNLDRTPPAVAVRWPPVPVFSTDLATVEVEGLVFDGLSGPGRAALRDAFGDADLPAPEFAVTRALQTASDAQDPRANRIELEATDGAGNVTRQVLVVNQTLQSFMLAMDPSRVELRAGVLSSVDRALVGFEPTTSRERIHQIAHEEGGRVAGFLNALNMAQLVFATQSVAELEAIVQRVQARPEVAAALPAFFSASQVFDNELLAPPGRDGYDHIRLLEAANFLETSGVPLQRTGIAIVDSGLAFDFGRSNELAGVTYVDLCSAEGGVARPDHGTAVTGIVAGANNGQGNNGVVSGLTGSDFTVTAYGTGCGPRLDCGLMALAFDDIVAGRRGDVHVVNMSFSAAPTEPGVELGLESFYEHIFGSNAGTGILWVAGAGNDGREVECGPGGFPAYPAALACLMPNVVAVAGHEPSSGLRAPESNHGPGITLSAPWAAETAIGPDAYGLAMGTSVAAPLVSGAAALLHAVRPAATPSSIKRALVETAQPLAAADLPQGGLDVRALLEAEQAPVAPLRRDTFNGESPGGFALEQAVPVVIPGLAGFALDFDTSLFVDTVAAGFHVLAGIEGTVMLVDYSDGHDNDPYSWTVNRQELPPGTTIHHVKGTDVNISQLLDHPLGMQAVPVLLGFRLDSPFANVAVERIQVELTTGFGAFYLHVVFPFAEGPGFDERFEYEVTYALVPLDRVRAVGEVEGSDAGGTDSAALNAAQPVLRGFELISRNGPIALDRFLVRVRPGRASVSFSDSHFNDAYGWRLAWADIE